MIAIFTDIKAAQEYSDKIHEWLKLNRKGYTADAWSKMELSSDEKAERYYVKVPEDYEKLNAEILTKEGKLELPRLTVTSIVDKLPDNWRITADIGEK